MLSIDDQKKVFAQGQGYCVIPAPQISVQPAYNLIRIVDVKGGKKPFNDKLLILSIFVEICLRTRACIWPVTTSKSNTDTSRNGVKKRFDLIKRRVKINLVLIMVGKASRNAINNTSQSAKSMPT